MGHSKSNSKREVYINISLFQEENPQKSQINYLTLHLKEPEKEEQSPKLLKEGNNKDKSVNNKIEPKNDLCN